MKKLTADQRDKLEKAIDGAQGFGLCQYVIDDGPGCVIGQLAALEGVPIPTLKAWDRLDDPSVEKIPLPGSLKAYGDGLLCDLQRTWDNARAAVVNPDVARAAMRELVREHGDS